MPPLPERQRFDNFAVGPANRAAVSAARAVAGAPGAVYNPLFLHGPPGLGKSHLLNALGYAVRAAWADAVIEHLPVADFAGQLHSAAAAGRLEGFRRRFGAVDLLLLDDVDRLAGEVALQEELLQLCSTLRENAGQMVFAGAAPPDALSGFEARFLACLTGGLVVGIDPLDEGTRLAILRQWEADRGPSVGEAALAALAGRPLHDVPALREAFDAESVLPRKASATSAPVGTAPGPGRPFAPDEYESFLEEIATVVSRSVEQWRLRLAEAIARWSGEGFRTDLLERYLEAVEVPDLEALEAGFVARVNRLRTLEAEAVRLDPMLSGLSVFRDPEREAEAEAVVLRALATFEALPGPNPHRRLDGLVVGLGNHLALRAVADVVARAGSAPTTVYLHGPEGSGKSHVLHGIGNALLARAGSPLTVTCVDAAMFATGLSTALHEGTLERWRMRFRSMDVVLLDDLHRLQGNADAEAEWARLLEECRAANRLVVMTADRTPGGLTFASGLVAAVQGGLVLQLGRVSEAERVALHTPVPAGAEAAAPTIDLLFEEVVEEAPEPRAAAFRAVLKDLDPFFLDPEKVVMDWPGIEGRVVEEYR